VSRMCFKKKKLPGIKLLSMFSPDVERELAEFELMYPCLLDAGRPYWYTNAEGWADIFNYIYCEFPMPKYVASRCDCEDFAIHLKGLVSALFGLNYFAIAVGDAPAGKHAFNLFRDDTGLMIIEPQTANYFILGEQEYEPEYILL